MESSHFLGRQFSMTPSTKRCSSIFDLGPLTPQIYSPKLLAITLHYHVATRGLALGSSAPAWRKSAIHWMTELRGQRLLPSCHAHGNKIWPRRGDLDAYQLVLLITRSTGLIWRQTPCVRRCQIRYKKSITGPLSHAVCIVCPFSVYHWPTLVANTEQMHLTAPCRLSRLFLPRRVKIFGQRKLRDAPKCQTARIQVHSFWTRERIPNGYERCCCCCCGGGGSCCYQIFKVC